MQDSQVNDKMADVSKTAQTESQEPKLTNYMKECLDKVAYSEGFKNFEIKVNNGSRVGAGDGFVGVLFKALIQEIESGKNLTVVVKSPPENVQRRNLLGAMTFFKREVRVYNDVLPEFVKFQEEKGIKPSDGFFQFPKCYFAECDDEEKDDANAIIVLEDLSERGFQLWDKMKPLDLNHATKVIKALGRLHAISFAMKAQKPELFEKFKDLNDYFTGRIGDPNFGKAIHVAVDKAVGTLDEDDSKSKARVLKLKEDVKSLMLDLTGPAFAEPYAVVGHGDCWSNNFMYKYKSATPEEIVLLDYQITRYASPVLDLVYFFFLSTDSTLRAKHYDELLNIYHRSLKELLDKLGGNTLIQFPFTALLRQLKQFGKFGIVMASLTLPLLTTKKEKLPDMNALQQSTGADDMLKVANDNLSYEPRMKNAILDAIQYKYL